MILRMKARLTAIVIAAIAVAALAGVGAVMAAQGSSPSASSPRTSTGASSQQTQDYDAQGVIKQVTFDQGTTKSGSLDFLPKDKQTTVKVTFTTATRITVGSDGSDGDHSNSGQGTLKAGMTVEVKGTLQTDGSVQASDIRAGTQDGNDNDDQNGQDDDGNSQNYQSLVGVVQSVDKSAQTFVLLPDGQTTPVTIAYDSKTEMGDESDSGTNAGLVQGAHVRVEAVKRADGSLYAKDVDPVSTNGCHDGGDSGNNGQPTPTPTSTPCGGGSGSGD